MVGYQQKNINICLRNSTELSKCACMPKQDGINGGMPIIYCHLFFIVRRRKGSPGSLTPSPLPIQHTAQTQSQNIRKRFSTAIILTQNLTPSSRTMLTVKYAFQRQEDLIIILDYILDYRGVKNKIKLEVKWG